jgi:hypothetical protein
MALVGLTDISEFLELFSSVLRGSLRSEHARIIKDSANHTMAIPQVHHGLTAIIA